MSGRPPSELIGGLKEQYDRRGPIRTVIGVIEYVIHHPYDTVIEMGLEEFEKGLSAPVPLKTRVAMYRLGFQSHHYYLYNFDSGADPDSYLSEFPRKAYTGIINEDSSLLDDKEKFHDLLDEYGFSEYLPDLFGRLENEEFRRAPLTNLLELLEVEQRLVIKPVSGAAGSGVMICEWKNGRVIVNGERMTKSEFTAELQTLEPSLVTEYCRQSKYSADIYPNSANSIRVLTMHPDGEPPFIALAVHRIGTDSTGGLDNFSQGGLSAEVDLRTGELSRAAECLPGGRVRWHDVHPDTKSKIEGVATPGWDSIKEQLLEIVQAIPELRYVGWDVLVTGPGEFVLLEGNNRSDVDLLQIHRPLLADDRIRDFYRENGVPV